jgi:isocitrate dehydrogenase
VNELDNRGTHFHLAKHWANKMAAHDSAFVELSEQLQSNEGTILKDLLECQGKPQDIGGYYQPDRAKAQACMRPSQTFNEILGTKF